MPAKSSRLHAKPKVQRQEQFFSSRLWCAIIDPMVLHHHSDGVKGPATAPTAARPSSQQVNFNPNSICRDVVTVEVMRPHVGDMALLALESLNNRQPVVLYVKD